MTPPTSDGPVPAPGAALPADERPVDRTPIDTDDLPPTPIRDRNIPAGAWRQAPAVLLELGSDLPDTPEAMYKRRIGPWLLWRAGPASRGHARYLALRADDLGVHHSFRLFPDGAGEGSGPSGASHGRFRSWKQDLLGAGSDH
jgi:hypothetical protein